MRSSSSHARPVFLSFVVSARAISVGFMLRRASCQRNHAVSHSMLDACRLLLCASGFQLCQSLSAQCFSVRSARACFCASEFGPLCSMCSVPHAWQCPRLVCRCPPLSGARCVSMRVAWESCGPGRKAPASPPRSVLRTLPALLISGCQSCHGQGVILHAFCARVSRSDVESSSPPFVHWS